MDQSTQTGHRRGQSPPAYLESVPSIRITPPTAYAEHRMSLPNNQVFEQDVEAILPGLSPQRHDPNARPATLRNWIQETLFVFITVLSSASTTLVQGSLIIITSAIARGLAMEIGQISWITAAVGYSIHSLYEDA